MCYLTIVVKRIAFPQKLTVKKKFGARLCNSCNVARSLVKRNIGSEMETPRMFSRVSKATFRKKK